MLSFNKNITIITFITLCAAFFASSIQANDTLVNTSGLKASINAALTQQMEALKQQINLDASPVLIATKSTKNNNKK